MLLSMKTAYPSSFFGDVQIENVLEPTAPHAHELKTLLRDWVNMNSEAPCECS